MFTCLDITEQGSIYLSIHPPSIHSIYHLLRVLCIPTESHDGYNLSVSAVFEDSNRLTLICSLINATLLSGQELIWTEGNVEVNYSNVDKVVTSNSSILNIDNITEAHYGVYTCQCYNRQNYTLNELHKLINNEFYVHHCSENISVTAIPTGKLVHYITDIKITLIF